MPRVFSYHYNQLYLSVYQYKVVIENRSYNSVLRTRKKLIILALWGSYNHKYLIKKIDFNI